MTTDRVYYLALSELMRRYRTEGMYREGIFPHNLTSYELKVTSQNGEDGVIAELLSRLGMASRSFVEFGVEDGREGNCVMLAEPLGWSGLFMESDAQQYELLAERYRLSDVVRTRQATVTPDNVEALLREADVPDDLDLLSIDVDGNDYWIWAAIERVRPRIVVIEYNAALDPQRRLVQPLDTHRRWRGTDNFGASLGALRTLGERKGYRLVHTESAGVNAFFVRKDCEASMPAPRDVAIRSPNYSLCGLRHPPDPDPTPYVDLDLAAPDSAKYGMLRAPAR